tara:strand:- start:1615 stop:2832 length:1218 start_codon:yes stop_codon:yes gene_type:complete
MENNLNLEEGLIPNSNTANRTGGLLFNNILDLRIYEFFFITIYLLIFIFFIKHFIKNYTKYKNQIYFLITYHFIFVIFAYIYSLLYVNDVDTFFQSGFLFEIARDDIHGANDNIIMLNNILIYFFNLHYFTIFIFLGFFSSIGLILLYVSFNELLKNYDINKNKLLLLFLFPSWHFFSSFPGKDSIILFSIGFFYFILFKKKFFYLILPMSLMYFVRPHIMYLTLIVTLIAFANNFLIEKIKNKTSYIIFLILLVCAIFFLVKLFLPSYFEFLYYFFEKGVILRNYSSEFSGWYETGNNILTNSILYVVYPIFDFSSLQRIIISVENCLICFVTLLTIIKFEKKLFFDLIKKKEILFGIIFFLFGIVILSNFSANIGINSRQKWMLMPSLLIFLAPLITKSKNYK